MHSLADALPERLWFDARVTVAPPIALPTDLEAAHALILAQREALAAAEGEIKVGALLIEKLRHTIAKLRHERFGQKAERGCLLDQLSCNCSSWRKIRHRTRRQRR